MFRSEKRDALLQLGKVRGAVSFGLSSMDGGDVGAKAPFVAERVRGAEAPRLIRQDNDKDKHNDKD